MFSTASKVGAEKHPNSVAGKIKYGTAGFRTKADVLDHVMYRMGILAALRSKMKKATIGVMITASHNPECDNGVKLVDPKGEMLEQKWEALATDLANASDSELASVLENIVSQQGIPMDAEASVFVGRDTRKSSPALSTAVLDGVNAVKGSSAKDFGIVSTPMIHYFVVCKNTDGAYGECSEKGYNEKLSKAFKTIRGQASSNGGYSPKLYVDGANGVGAGKLKAMLASGFLGDSLDVTIVNDGTASDDVLNHQCGADFVKVEQRSPKGLESVEGERCCSFDGDADRVMYFFNDGDRFRMLDGDKIATLVAGYLKELLSAANIKGLNLGLVQTAYANGSSTNYITKKLNVPVTCVPTGVKHLHHAALDFDIGVYFEANGHGTVVFSDKAMETIRSAAAKSISTEAQKLSALVDVINQTVGDAISDMLLVETVLHSKGWSGSDWISAYDDLPNRQMKVKVADRTAIATEDAERRAKTPAGLQDRIETIVAKFKDGRSFVRPSGTEDVVRVYAEADTQYHADSLALHVANAVYEMAGGVGDKPIPPQ